MTTKMYTVEGMKCDGCVAAVRTALRGVDAVIEAQVQLPEPQAIVSMREEIPDEVLQAAVSHQGSYHIRPYDDPQAPPPAGRADRRPGKFWRFLAPKKECCR